MVMGRVNKYLKEVCLVDQIWVKNSDYTITKYLQEESKKIGADIKSQDLLDSKEEKESRKKKITLLKKFKKMHR